MNRRKVLIGLGGAVAGGGALLGTGAFTTVEAERTVTVNTEGDAGALLALDPSGDGENSNVVQSIDGLLEINFDAAANGSQGINLNALTTVGDVDLDDDDLTAVNDEALTITNNSTQTIDISFEIGFNSEQEGENIEENDVEDILKLWTDTDGNGNLDDDDLGNLVANDLEGLESGESVDVALQIDTVELNETDINTDEPLFEDEATITATSQLEEE